MHHHHDHHSHGDHHHPHPAQALSHGRAFGIAIFLNSAFVIAEFVFGYLANSTALLADAGHNLSDVLGLALAWGAAILARRAPSQRFSYGLRGSSTLAALANAGLLLLACGAIGWEAMQRFFAAPQVQTQMVLAVAAVGILVNGFSALLFMRGRASDLNVRGAYLHMAADAAVSLGVVLTAVLIRATDWNWLDPLASLLIVAVIIYGTWGLLREALQLALNAVPAQVDQAGVEAYLRALPGVSDVHDLHIWGISTTECALTVHLVLPAGYPGDLFVDQVVQTLETRFAVQHSTVQVELGTTDHRCTLHAGLAPLAHQHT